MDFQLTPNQDKRVFNKKGHANVAFRRMTGKSRRYIRDFVTTLIEINWKYMLIMFIGSYFLSWFLFAILNYLVSYSHGDVRFDQVTGERLSESEFPCIIGVDNFVSMLIYSIETQSTIGFGEKYPGEECPEAIFLFMMQIVFSIAIEGAMISIIYAKAAIPLKQITKLKYSDKAVICYRDDKLCLLFRVYDIRKQFTIETKIRAFMIIDKISAEGEFVRTHETLKLVNNGEPIIAWPETVCHVIDETSPLYSCKSARDLNAAHFELIVTTCGSSLDTGLLTEARTSYMPNEIFWGQRFINIIHYDFLNSHYIIDYKNFNTTISVDMMN